MGAWGTGPFDNDDALDLLVDAAESGDVVDGLRAALVAVKRDGYLDARDVNMAVAAAAVVGARAGAPHPRSGPAADFVDAYDFATDDALRALARQALERAFEPRDNEWSELWDEVGLLPAVREALAPYRAPLAS